MKAFIIAKNFTVEASRVVAANILTLSEAGEGRIGGIYAALALARENNSDSVRYYVRSAGDQLFIVPGPIDPHSAGNFTLPTWDTISKLSPVPAEGYVEVSYDS